MNKVELQQLVGGALQEKFSKSFSRVLDNLKDPNTPFKNKRSITIKMTFEQNENRDDVKCEIDILEKLAAQSGMKTNFWIGQDLQTGEVIAEEYGKQIKGQMSIKDYEKSVETIGTDIVDTETGEVLNESESIVDFRKAVAK